MLDGSFEKNANKYSIKIMIVTAFIITTSSWNIRDDLNTAPCFSFLKSIR